MRKLASDSVIYGLGSVANQALSFLLLPLYTRYLTPADYGTLALVSAVGALMGLIATFGVHSGLLRIFFLHDDPRERAAVVFTAWVFAVASSLVVGPLLLGLGPWLGPLVLDVPNGQTYYRYAVALNCLLALATVGLATLQAYQRPRPYILATLTGLVVASLANIYLVAVAGRGIEGVLEGQILGIAAQLAISTSFSAPRIVAALRGGALRDMLAFCLPLLPTNLAAWGLSLADRWFLKEFASLTDVGLYALGFRFGTVLDVILIRPFQQAWFPYLFSILSEPFHRDVCARVLEYYTFLGGGIVLGMSLFGPEVIHVIADPSYRGAESVIFWVGLGFLLRGMTFVTVAGIHIGRKTHYSAYAYLLGVVLNVALLALLVPRFGVSGAAWATVGTYAAIAGGLFVIAQRLHPIPYRPDRVGILLALLALLAAAGRLVPSDSLAVSLPEKIGLLAAYPGLLLLGGFFRPDEISRARVLLGRALPGGGA